MDVSERLKEIEKSNNECLKNCAGVPQWNPEQVKFLLDLITRYREALNDVTSILFQECQPDRGDLFSKCDDVMLNALEYNPDE